RIEVLIAAMVEVCLSGNNSRPDPGVAAPGSLAVGAMVHATCRGVEGGTLGRLRRNSRKSESRITVPAPHLPAQSAPPAMRRYKNARLNPVTRAASLIEKASLWVSDVAREGPGSISIATAPILWPSMNSHTHLSPSRHILSVFRTNVPPRGTSLAT